MIALTARDDRSVFFEYERIQGEFLSSREGHQGVFWQPLVILVYRNGSHRAHSAGEAEPLMIRAKYRGITCESAQLICLDLDSQ